MENFAMNSYDTIVFNQTNCRKKLNFNDQTNDTQQQQKKLKKNMAIVSGTVQMCTQYQKDQQIKMPKMPSNTKRNARERKRVRTINDYFSQLQKFLPHSKQISSQTCSTATLNSNKKLSKVETLKAAIEYIEYLQTFSPMSSKSMNLSSSVSSSSPLSSSSSSTNTTLSSPSSVMTSPSLLNDKLKPNLTKQKQNLKSKLKQTSIQFDNSNTLSPIATVQPIQQLVKDPVNEAILNPIDFNVNYSATTNSTSTNDYYYNQQQCYNNNNYLQYSNSAPYRSDYYAQQQQQQTSQLVNQTNFYQQYSLESSMDSGSINQMNSTSPSLSSSPEISTSSRLSSNFNANSYATVSYNNQEQNLLINNYTASAAVPLLVDYHSNQINC